MMASFMASIIFGLFVLVQDITAVVNPLNVNRTNSYKMNAFTPCIVNEPVVIV